MKYYLFNILFIALFIVAPTASFAELQLEGSPIQSGLMRGQVSPGSQVYCGERQLKISPD